MLGSVVHTTWAQRNGMHWVLVELLPDGEAVIETPRTKKRITTKQDTLCYTRRNQPT